MKAPVLPLVALGISYLVFAAVVIGTWPLLPARVASHFNAGGQPDGWMSRARMLHLTIGTGLLLPLFLGGIMVLLSRLPKELMHGSNLTYWLSPEGQARKSDIMLRCGFGFAWLTVLLVTGLHLLLVEANTFGSARLSRTGIALLTGGYGLGMMICAGLLLLRFLNAPNAQKVTHES